MLLTTAGDDIPGLATPVFPFLPFFLFCFCFAMAEKARQNSWIFSSLRYPVLLGIDGSKEMYCADCTVVAFGD